MCGVQAEKRKGDRGEPLRLMARSTQRAQEGFYQKSRDFFSEHLRQEIKVEKQEGNSLLGKEQPYE